MNELTAKKIRTMSGTVVSAKMDKTIVVKVVTNKAHPFYGKRVNWSKKYKVHDPENKFQTGDEVQFFESRPFSKDKKWQVIYQ